MKITKRLLNLILLLIKNQQVMKRIIEDYGLRFYVTHSYVLLANQRGGQIFNPYYKKDLKPFQLRVKYAINRSDKVLYDTFEKYPITTN